MLLSFGVQMFTRARVFAILHLQACVLGRALVESKAPRDRDADPKTKSKERIVNYHATGARVGFVYRAIPLSHLVRV